jgi:hypothetical protein
MQQLSGRILKPSMESRFADECTSSLAVIPARERVSPASDSEKQTLDGFGRILKESFAQYNLFGASSRTSQDTLQLDSPQFIEAYEIWVTRLRQDCLQRQRSARHTRENGCLSWPTPDTMPDAPNSGSNKKNVPKNFHEAIKWSTPSVSRGGYTQKNGETIPKLDQQVKYWPTVTAQDAKNNAGPSQYDRNSYPLNVAIGLLDQDNSNMNGKNRDVLWRTPQGQEPGINPDRLMGQDGARKYDKETGRLAQYGLTQQIKGKLNPDWVEQLMGLPQGWTDFDFSETESCPNVQN